MLQLAYSSYPEGCVLITDAMKILDPNLKDGVHEWRDGKRFVKSGDKLYLEGTDTLAGRCVLSPLDPATNVGADAQYHIQRRDAR